MADFKIKEEIAHSLRSNTFPCNQKQGYEACKANITKCSPADKIHKYIDVNSIAHWEIIDVGFMTLVVR